LAVRSDAGAENRSTEAASLNPFASILRMPAPGLKDLIGLGFAVDGYKNVGRRCLLLVQGASQCRASRRNLLKYRNF
jgi:hypothetical protein